jgi:hypothetical protein
MYPETEICFTELALKPKEASHNQGPHPISAARRGSGFAPLEGLFRCPGQGDRRDRVGHFHRGLLPPVSSCHGMTTTMPLARDDIRTDSVHSVWIEYCTFWSAVQRRHSGVV